ncbi:hypothetical protein FRC09_013094 [Ceratobasidium sp. 395]|nr:hypothetical protein FRC09_013094 [Ceratobasidium sp. 395]
MSTQDNNPSTRLGRSITCLVQILWFLVCVATLGFPAKYLEWLRLFEDLVPDLDEIQAWTRPPKYSYAGDPKSGIKTQRQMQQEEWDRLNIAVSVITATSAAALAIQAVSAGAEIYWLVTTFYSIAFGLSLQGLILITYATISAGGASDEAICRLAKGKLVADGSFAMVKPVAFVMALPAIFATYSSISLLAGLVAMVMSGPGKGVAHEGSRYITATMIPVGGGFLCLGTALFFCEVGTWIEMRGRAPYREIYRQTTSPQATSTSLGELGVLEVRVITPVPMTYRCVAVKSQTDQTRPDSGVQLVA